MYLCKIFIHINIISVMWNRVLIKQKGFFTEHDILRIHF